MCKYLITRKICNFENCFKILKNNNFLAIHDFLLLKKEMQIDQYINSLVLLKLILHYLLNRKLQKITIATNFCLATDTWKFQMKWPFF